jgi:predicted nucleic acid-binding protein
LTLKDPHGLAVLAGIITSTPGTVWVEHDVETGTLTLHVLVANVARTKVRRRELSREAAEVLLDGIEKWPLDVVHVDWKDAWRLAWKHELTGYDAAYLWLSVDRELPLVTLDGELADAAGTRARP